MRMQTPLLEALVNDGYTLSLKSYVTQNRQDLADSQALNYTGGLNEPESKRTTVAETIHIKNTDPPDWQLNRFWQNSVIHELGHALADIIGRQKAAAMTNPDEAELKAKVEKWGASELPEFTTAWQADYDQMPKEVQEMWLPIGYYVSVGKDGKRTVSRQETFAETFDILVRGKYSTYNHDNFQQYFPRTLQAVANLIENHFQLPPLPYRPNLKKD